MAPVVSPREHIVNIGYPKVFERELWFFFSWAFHVTTKTHAWCLFVRLSVPSKMSHSHFVVSFFHAASWIIHHWKGLAKYYKIVKKILKTGFQFEEMYFQKMSQHVTLAFCDLVFPRSKLDDTSLERSCEVLRDSEKWVWKTFWKKFGFWIFIWFSSEMVHCKKIAFLFNLISSYLTHCLVFAHKDQIPESVQMQQTGCHKFLIS